MDQHNAHSRGRSPSAASTGAQTHQQARIKHSPSPSPARFPNSTESASASVGLGLGIGLETISHPHPFSEPQVDFSAYDTSAGGFINDQQSQVFARAGLADPSAAFDPHPGFGEQQLADDNSSFRDDQAQTDYQQNPFPSFGDPDFTIFPPTSGDQFGNTSLFADDNQQLDISDNTMMTQTNHTPTPPHLLNPDPLSANHSPSFNQHQFSSSPGRHSRNASLGPEAALLPGQLDWSHPQFQGHRRTPSEYSDVSSVAPSPHLGSSANFDAIDPSHSPMQRPQDAGLYQELHEMGTFSISDSAQSPNPQGGRSPSHSPAMSPRIVPQPLPTDMSQQPAFMLQAPNNSFGPPVSYVQVQQVEAFPEMPGQMPAPPSINIDYAPTASRNGFDQPKSLDVDSLTPPDRGRPRQRPRAVTDPFNPGGAVLGARASSANLSPNAAIDPRSGASRSLSPLDRSGSGSSATSPNRRRQSTSAVPNNVIALRLADPEYNGPGAQGENGNGGPKRVQKHPATFQCTLCPKRFTRAYNLRSHLRTHTDERPFVCTVCGKAFARQHDRKRHEGLHSGEKKFVCKGELKAGGQWGCGRRFARADALGRHFRSEAGRVCIKALLDEEMHERQRAWNEQRMQQAAAQGMVMQPPPGLVMGPGMDPSSAYPMDPSGNYGLPAALLAQYPALAQVNWSSADLAGGGGSGMEDDLSGRSSFDASDYDDADDGGYVSGPGTGFGAGGMQEGFGELGYTSDYGGR